MIDDRTEELLNRYLDEDLGPAEIAALEARLAAEPELRSILEELRQVQASVGRLAEAMEPPAELDALMEPLRRGRGANAPRRTMLVLLSAAACVVIGFTVLTEMRDHGPAMEEAERRRPQVAVGSSGDYYQLQPLPTAEPGTPMLGAADRLLASPGPGVTVPGAEPLQVYGPMSEDEVADLARSTAGQAGSAEDERTRAVGPWLRLALEVAGTVVAVDERLDGELPAARYPVRITVADGRVVRCVSHGAPPDAYGEAVCAVVGALQVPGQSDGTVDALAVVRQVEP